MKGLQSFGYFMVSLGLTIVHMAFNKPLFIDKVHRQLSIESVSQITINRNLFTNAVPPGPLLTFLQWLVT
jgi:hypothetical protein